MTGQSPLFQTQGTKTGGASSCIAPAVANALVRRVDQIADFADGQGLSCHGQEQRGAVQVGGDDIVQFIGKSAAFLVHGGGAARSAEFLTRRWEAL